MGKSISITVSTDLLGIIDSAARKERMKRSEFLREVLEAAMPLFGGDFYPSTLYDFHWEMGHALEGKLPANID